MYVPPDPPGYFDAIIFPEYLKHKEFVEKNIRNVNYVDGYGSQSEICEAVVENIKRLLGIE